MGCHQQTPWALVFALTQPYWEHQALRDILQALERPNCQPNQAGYHRLIAEWLAMVTTSIGHSSLGASLTLLRACRRRCRCGCEACRAAAVHTVVVPYITLWPVANGSAFRPRVPAASTPDLSNDEQPGMHMAATGLHWLQQQRCHMLLLYMLHMHTVNNRAVAAACRHLTPDTRHQLRSLRGPFALGVLLWLPNGLWSRLL